MPQRPEVDHISIRELQETAAATLAWPARLVWSWPVFLVVFFVALIAASKVFGERANVLGCAPFVYLGIAMGGYSYCSDRAYSRAWATSSKPEPGRLFRRLSQLSVAGIGVCLAITGVVFAIDERWGARVLQVSGMGMMVLGAVSFASSMAWSYQRAPEVWKMWAPQQWGKLAENAEAMMGGSSYGRSFAAALHGLYEPGAGWTAHDDPKLVAWASALRAGWRNGWTVSAPTRYFLLLWGGWLGRLITFRPGRVEAVAALAVALGATVIRYDERAILDWLDARGWGPAPHAPGVWIGTRYTLRGGFAGVPVAVSVVHRLPSSRTPSLERIDIFLAARLAAESPWAGQLQARAVSLGYSTRMTPWGIVFSRNESHAQALSAGVVTQLLSGALGAGASRI